ncbi:aldo/keto reductase [Actinomadura citrea]|jgi:aryl-alcohol dehydrogenase-like predicted oxidoreductase|uniref:Aryl-alcohol dehydrogenase-like predicted oxidoreductase n=1 Tax=Actinomadura citrea TaxID=46158 RepID=A0A7Y9GF63_9ACTN|nr:aldo/keto reductase [Actinomadura citrea]NYE15378.1 aryl-alcohol dehydrogenase-like predicted oxidoreductase [Actinomadura citrea]GGT99621.1 oxidoreductase [Actinomadura citrea]
MTRHFDLGGDLRISRMGFGAMRLPVSTLGGPANDRGTGIKILQRAVELGVDHIDTAAFYYYEGGPAANEMIRAALAPYPPGLVVATKVGPYRGPGDPYPSGQLPASELRAEVERNLTELGLDRLDLVYLRPGGLEAPSDEPVGERFAVLAGLREEGLIRHLGLSHVSPAQLEEARGIAPVAAVQNRFDVTRSRDAELLASCEREHIAYAPYFPLGGFGIPDDARVNAIAARHGATVPQVLLAGLLALSPVMLAIPGTGSPAHLEENLAAADLTLAPEDLAALKR